MTAPTVVLRIDLAGTAFGGTPSWTTVASADLLTGSQYPIEITWGAQDEQSEPSPRTCSFYLENADGAWTPGNASADAQWDVGCRVNVRVTHNAVTYDRFDGYVDSIEPTWPGGKPSWSVVKVSCTDVSARLGIGQPLRSMPVEEILGLSATALYRLDDETDATALANAVTGGPAASLVRSGPIGSAYTLGGLAGSGFIAGDPASGLDLTPLTSGGVSTSGYMVRTATSSTGTLLDVDNDFSVAVWFNTSGPALTHSAQLFSQHDGSTVRAAIYYNHINNTVTAEIADDSLAPIVLDSGAPIGYGDNAWHRAVLTWDQATFDAVLYIDGQVADSLNYGGVATWNSNGIDQTWGGSSLATSSFFTGSLKLLTMWAGTALSAAQVLTDFEAGACFDGELSGARFARIAAYGGVTTSGLPTGSATMGVQFTEGQTVTEALAKVARTEGTQMWVTGAGALTFAARTARWHSSTALSLAGSDIKADSFSTRRDRQGFANECSASRDGSATQRYVDTASQTAVGRFDAGTLDVAPSTDHEAYNLAAWRVETSNTPKTRLPSLTVDLYALTSTTTIANCLTATVGSRVALSSLPSNAPATSMTLFVEGAGERIGYAECALSFFTSPLTHEDEIARLDDATYGVLGNYKLGL